MNPSRIQLRRTKGWRMPPNTVKVARPATHGNPFRVGGHYKRCGGFFAAGMRFVYLEAFEGHQDSTYTTIKTNAEAVEWFRWYLGQMSTAERAAYLAPLRGKNVACFCGLDEDCHGDVLLEASVNG